MKVGSLFSGFGLMDLGLQQAGMEIVWQVENNEYAQKVLEKHWPGLRRWDDVRTFPPEPIEEWRVDLISGGFPCTDISNAGKRKGIGGPSSGLWTEMFRIICLLRPRCVLVENVGALRNRGLGRVLGDLAGIGYDSEWESLQAWTFGAAHIRERIFIAAYPKSDNGPRRKWHDQIKKKRQAKVRHSKSHPVADTNWDNPQTRIFRAGREILSLPLPCRGTDQPGVDRVAYAVPHRMERLVGLGNGVFVPCAQWIGERIMEAEANR